MRDKTFRAEAFPQIYLAISTGQEGTSAFRIDFTGLVSGCRWVGFVFTDLPDLSL